LVRRHNCPAQGTHWWNAKVSDFGVTLLREEMCKSGSKDAQGSLPEPRQRSSKSRLTLLHNDALCSISGKYLVYNVIFVRDRNGGEDSLRMDFPSPLDAINWCVDVQRILLGLDWP
jgi:hypothetical protein